MISDKFISLLSMQVRRCSERGAGVDSETDNTKILLDWLTEQVKEIQAEMRSVVTRLTDSEAPVRQTELEDVALALGRVDKRVQDLRLREERQGVKLEEVTFDLDHLKKEKVRSSYTICLDDVKIHLY